MNRDERETTTGDQPRPRRNFSVRLADELYASLDALSAETGESMNRLVGTAVARLVERPDLAPTASAADINPTIAKSALRQGPDAIGPLKGIAKHAMNRDQIALACVLYAAAARLVSAVDGPVAASSELARTAESADKSGYYELAVALWEEALDLDSNNLEATNRLGQRLHHLAAQNGDDLARYREAESLLARATFIDNHAKLFHGWAALHVARADGDRLGEGRAADEIDEALKHWAFGQRDARERARWMRQLERLRGLGFGERVDALIEFADRNSSWGRPDPDADMD